MNIKSAAIEENRLYVERTDN